MRELLDHGTFPAIATHDPAMIEATKRTRRARAIAKDRFEFQMLYGIRRDLQTSLVADGYRRPRLRAVRQAMVSVFHAPPRRAAGERRLRAARHSARALRNVTSCQRSTAAPARQARRGRRARSSIVHPLLDAVQAGAGRTEQQRRNAGVTQHRRVGPEAHPGQRRRRHFPGRRLLHCLRQQDGRRRSRTASARTSAGWPP